MSSPQRVILNNPVFKKEVVKEVVAPLAGLIYLVNLWKAYQVSKIDKAGKGGQQDTFWTTVGGVLFPRYYSAFKIAKYVPEGNSFSHIIGQLLIPGFYSSYQMAKLRQRFMPQTSNGTFEKGLAIMASAPYGAYAATTLANQPKLFAPKRRPVMPMFVAVSPNTMPMYSQAPVSLLAANSQLPQAMTPLVTMAAQPVGYVPSPVSPY